MIVQTLINSYCLESQPINLGWNNAISACENLTIGNHSTWRLPNINELYSLFYDTMTVPPYINQNYFPNSEYRTYWSSTGQNGSAWVPMGGPYGWSSELYVRCVTGP